MLTDKQYEQWSDALAADQTLELDPCKGLAGKDAVSVVPGRYGLDGTRGQGSARIRVFRISQSLDQRVNEYIEANDTASFSDLVREALEEKLAS